MQKLGGVKMEASAFLRQLAWDETLAHWQTRKVQVLAVLLSKKEKKARNTRNERLYSLQSTY